ncbi:MAG: hypothetical protein AAF559_03400 [Pseudomonadota bacterium]
MITARRWLALGLIYSALALSSVANAQGRCPVVRALSSSKPGSLEGVGVTVNSDGRMNVTRYGVLGVLRGADSCMLDITEDSFDLDRDWSYDEGQEDAAERTFDGLRRGLDECLPDVLEKQAFKIPKPTEEELQAAEARYGTSYRRYLEMTEKIYRFDSVIERKDTGEVAVQLSMTRKRDTGRVSINATFYR